jgi:hypothetical protein
VIPAREKIRFVAGTPVTSSVRDAPTSISRRCGRRFRMCLIDRHFVRHGCKLSGQWPQDDDQRILWRGTHGGPRRAVPVRPITANSLVIAAEDSPIQPSASVVRDPFDLARHIPHWRSVARSATPSIAHEAEDADRFTIERPCTVNVEPGSTPICTPKTDAGIANVAETV